jgi:hypothetical protein
MAGDIDHGHRWLPSALGNLGERMSLNVLGHRQWNAPMRAKKSSPSAKLARYRAKRDFAQTSEPAGDSVRPAESHSYLIQKHAATRLHYDFRLELGGVLKSWAVTRGPSLNSRMAIGRSRNIKEAS